MQLENRTPHAIGLQRTDGTLHILPPVRPTVRLELVPGKPEPLPVAGMLIYARVSVQGISGLPPPRPGVFLVVSQVAAMAIHALYPEREDCLHPLTGIQGAVRKGPDGGIISVTGLVRA